MKRWMVSGMSVSVCFFISSGRADEVIWRSAKDRPAATPTAPKTVTSTSLKPPASGSFQPIDATAAPGRSTKGWTYVQDALPMNQSQPPTPETPFPKVPVQPLNPTTPMSPPPPLPFDAPAKPASPAKEAELGTKPGTMPQSSTFTQSPFAERTGPIPTFGESTVIANPLPGGTDTFILPGVAGSEILPAGGIVAPGQQVPLFLVSAEYLFWWTRSANGPTLLSGQAPGVGNAFSLLNYRDLTEPQRDGLRLGGVYWLDCCGCYGIDGRIFFTGQRTGRYEISDAAGYDLYRPFFPANGPGTVIVNGKPVLVPPPTAEAVTEKGFSTGSFLATNTSQFWGGELNFRDCFWSGCNYRFDFLAGLRYLNLTENLTITENYTILSNDNLFFPADQVGTRVYVNDRFGTRNDFWGAQIGGAYQYRADRWTFDLRGTVALGNTHQKSSIEGFQARNPQNGDPKQTFTAPGGLLALDSNSGVRNRDVLSVVPEFGFNVGYQLTDRLRPFIGYNILYWNNVIRPGDQIDPVIDVTRVPRFVPPGVYQQVVPARPAANFNNTDFWAQGMTLGLEYRW